MIDSNMWMSQLTKLAIKEFGERLFFIGLQGSYRRGEATEQSDIDVVMILDNLSPDDLGRYRSLLAQLPEHEKACGFICGKKELKCWPNFDLLQVLYDTKSYYGSLDSLREKIKKTDVAEAIQIGLSVLYHSLCHSYLYRSNSKENLSENFKLSFFLLRLISFYKTGSYAANMQELLSLISGKEKEILNILRNRENLFTQSPEELEQSFRLLFGWCSEKLQAFA